MSFEDRIRAIANDREHGSSVLVDRICAEFRALQSEENAEHRLRWAFHQLRQIDASMVVVHHLLDTLEPHVGSDFFAELAAYESRWQHIDQAIADKLLAHRDFSGNTLITHSHSGILARVIRLLAGRVKGLQVCQTRSEPGGEGELQYRELQKAGLDVRLVNDADLPELASETDTAFLGTDQYNNDYFVNKIGSRRIVESMQALGKPTFVLGDSRKKVEDLKFSTNLFEKTPFGAGVILVTESGFGH